MNQYLINYLKDARKKKGFTQKQVAEQLGIAGNTLSGYENGISEPDIDTFIKMCNIYKIDYAQLMEQAFDISTNSKGLNLSISEENMIKKYRSIDMNGKETVDYVLNDIYDRCIKEPETKYETVLKPSYQCGLSAGTGLYVFDDVPSEQIEVPIEYKDIDFVIGVNGDSMEPTFKSGDKVMIKKHEVHIGEIGAFMVNGEAYIKELGNNELISHNKNYPNKEFNDGMRIDCIGKVVGKL